MDEVDVEPVDLGGELAETIEPRLAPAPIIGLGPIVADVFDPCQRRTLAPVVDQLGFRPAGPAQPGAEILEHIVTNGNAKRADGGVHGVSPGTQDLPRNIGLGLPRIKPPDSRLDAFSSREPVPTSRETLWMTLFAEGRFQQRLGLPGRLDERRLLRRALCEAALEGVLALLTQITKLVIRLAG